MRDYRPDPRHIGPQRWVINARGRVESLDAIPHRLRKQWSPAGKADLLRIMSMDVSLTTSCRVVTNRRSQSFEVVVKKPRKIKGFPTILQVKPPAMPREILTLLKRNAQLVLTKAA